jgi:hypothetical protein
MIIAIHAIIYSKHADKMREFLGDVLELPSVEAGEGWPIYAAPPTELAVHPTEGEPEHELYLVCDDINKTIAKLAEHGIKAEAVADRGWGLVTTLELPGGERMGLYEPKHPSPLR